MVSRILDEDLVRIRGKSTILCLCFWGDEIDSKFAGDK